METRRFPVGAFLEALFLLGLAVLCVDLFLVVVCRWGARSLGRRTSGPAGGSGALFVVLGVVDDRASRPSSEYSLYTLVNCVNGSSDCDVLVFECDGGG